MQIATNTSKLPASRPVEQLKVGQTFRHYANGTYVDSVCLAIEEVDGGGKRQITFAFLRDNHTSGFLKGDPYPAAGGTGEPYSGVFVHLKLSARATKGNVKRTTTMGRLHRIIVHGSMTVEEISAKPARR